MIEIIVGIWLGALIISILLTVLNVRYAIQLKNSKKYITLNTNLAKVGKFWSLTTENFKNLSEGSAKSEEDQTVRTAFYLGGLGLLGAPGLLFLSVITVSMLFLSKSRFTRRVFHSDLATNLDLNLQQVRQFIDELQSS